MGWDPLNIRCPRSYRATLARRVPFTPTKQLAASKPLHRLLVIESTHLPILIVPRVRHQRRWPKDASRSAFPLPPRGRVGSACRPCRIVPVPGRCEQADRAGIVIRSTGRCEQADGAPRSPPRPPRALSLAAHRSLVLRHPGHHHQLPLLKKEIFLRDISNGKRRWCRAVFSRRTCSSLHNRRAVLVVRTC